jgi:hypothetical protein
MLYENEFQNPQIFQQTISLFPEQSTLGETGIRAVIQATGKSTFEDGLRSGGSASDFK